MYLDRYKPPVPTALLHRAKMRGDEGFYWRQNGDRYEPDYLHITLHYFERYHDHHRRISGRNLDQATVFLLDYLTANGAGAAHAIAKARSFRHSVTRIGHAVSEIFLDLDNTLFAGKLSGKVNLEWACLGTRVSGMTTIPRNGFPKITIQLNVDLLHKEDVDHTVSALLHQMIHAYYLATCGIQTPGTGLPGGRLTHGRHFGAIMYEIKELSACRNGDDLPIGFGHDLNEDVGYRGRMRWDDEIIGDLPSTNRFVCSDCHPYHPMIPKAEIDAWVHGIRTPALMGLLSTPSEYVYRPGPKGLIPVKRSEAGPRDEWVALIYKNQQVQIYRTKLNNHTSLKSRFKHSNRPLNIPDVPEPIFLALCAFINTNTYPPDLAKVQNNTTGPPLILPHKPDHPAYLTTDIHLHALARALSFPELRTHALRRLHAQHLTHNDPVPALELIYKSHHRPDGDLRAWTRAFLARHAKPKPGGHPAETSNLHTLQTDPALRRGFAALLGRSEELEVDATMARSELEGMKKEPLPPPPPSAVDLLGAETARLRFAAQAAFPTGGLPAPAWQFPYGGCGYPMPVPPWMGAPPLAQAVGEWEEPREVDGEVTSVNKGTGQVSRWNVEKEKWELTGMMEGRGVYFPYG